VKKQTILSFYFCISFFLAAQNSSSASDWLHAGPLFDDFSLTLSSGNRAEAVGPLFYFEESESQKSWGVPPLCWGLHDTATDVEKFGFGYPVLTYNRYGTEYRWQLVQLFSFAGGRNQRDDASERFTIFPFYLSQRSADTNQNYTAFLPFYGHLKNRLFTDELFVIMFPVYSRSRKADVVTENYLFPIVRVRHGNSLYGWKVFPVAGHEHKDPTTRTNGFGDVETVPGHDSGFVLAPFYLYQRSGIGTDNPQDEQALLPFYSFVRSPHRDSTTVIWPLFTHVTDRQKKYREWETPWPIIVFARGEGKTTSRIWPFFSHAQNTNQESDFFLWPLYKVNRVHGETIDRSRTRILLFLYSDTNQKNLETGKARRRRDFWPLFTQTRDYNGNNRLQILAPLEPILPFSESVEREYSPMWSIWRAEKNPRTGAASQSLLWNLYRRDTTPSSKKCSLFFGLFQYQSSSEGRQMRWFYLPVMKTGAKPKPADAQNDTGFAGPEKK
jgi:hypothetical protein